MIEQHTNSQIIQLIDEAPEELVAYAHQEEQQDYSLKAGRGCSLHGWGSGAAQSTAFYLIDSLNRDNTEDVDWHIIAEHLNKKLPLKD